MGGAGWVETAAVGRVGRRGDRSAAAAGAGTEAVMVRVDGRELWWRGRNSLWVPLYARYRVEAGDCAGA